MVMGQVSPPQVQTDPFSEENGKFSMYPKQEGPKARDIHVEQEVKNRRKPIMGQALDTMGPLLVVLGVSSVMSGVVDTCEGQDALQRDLEKFKWVSGNLMKFNKAKFKLLHLGQINPGTNTAWGMGDGEQTCQEGLGGTGG
ncbi:hypothetical protein HGM15179_001986 [Zosterops borbonicus]|uniref:Uncharacterized protein n=1 Tax=Zosterops borbonicus TaxID=364589 RepID=A0A8K1LTH8_9PASS|nr:hypothetical protein HGM15179_001986 [Zosterops borbonicus]